jgi:hypothetical protein
MLKSIAALLVLAFLNACVTIPCQVPKERKGSVDYYSPSRPTQEELKSCEMNNKSVKEPN